MSAHPHSTAEGAGGEARADHANGGGHDRRISQQGWRCSLVTGARQQLVRHAATTGTNATGTVDLVTALDLLGLSLKADLDLNVPGGTTHAVGVVVSMTTGTSVVTLEIGVSQQNAAQLKAAQALPGSSSIVNLKTMTEPGSRAGA